MRINRTNLMQDKKLTATITERARMLCAQAKECEEAGEYEDARLALSEFWQRIGERPRLEGLAESERAELLLRAGTVSGWIGSARQIPGAQETAKDLISESATIFEELGQAEKVAEARVDLGICYWREGALDEARITFEDALLRLGDLQSEQRLRAILNLAIVEQVCDRPKEALRLLSDAEPLFNLSSNHSLKGKFHGEFGIVLKNIGLTERREDYFDRALMQYTAAGLELEQVNQTRGLAIVESNLGSLFAQLGRFEEAHAHLDRSVSLVRKLNDQGQLAKLDEMRARVFLDQGHLDQAEKVASAAVKGFREGDEQSNLATALTTHATVLARLGQNTEALSMLDQAIGVASLAGDTENAGMASLAIVEELASNLAPDNLRSHYVNAEAALKHSQHATIESRLGTCARLVLKAETQKGAAAEGAEADSAAGISLEEQVLRYEGELIRRALEASAGSVTRAARLLGVTHQGLAFILNGRQKNLLSSRKPAKPRRRSIIRYH
jgi:tetratricopeptide (TPR) repeat protein